MKTPAERQRRSRLARKDAGGSLLSIVLTPKASAKLAAHVASGKTAARTVNALLERSRPVFQHTPR